MELGSNVLLRDILAEVAKKHGLTVWDLRTKSRTARLVTARAEFYFRALSETDKSCNTIGYYCQSNHYGVLYGSAKHAVVHDLPLPRGYQARLKKVIHLRPDYEFNPNPTQKGKQEDDRDKVQTVGT